MARAGRQTSGQRHLRRQRRRRRRQRRPSSVARWPAWYWHRLRRWCRQRWRRWRVPLAAAVVALLAIAVAVKHFWPASRPARVTVESGDYNGIDVSRHQGRIDWQRVAADPKIQFVYIKATEGASLVDRDYERNFEQARAAGLKVGSYHFFTSYKSARAQFDNFKRHVDKSAQDLLPMVDVEEAGNRRATRQSLQPHLQEFMELVRAEYGQYPLLYSQYKFYNTLLAPEFNRYFIFIARYGRAEPVLRGGGKYNIWQYTERGHVDGISGAVDLDRFCNGTTLDDILL